MTKVVVGGYWAEKQAQVASKFVSFEILPLFLFLDCSHHFVRHLCRDSLHPALHDSFEDDGNLQTTKAVARILEKREGMEKAEHRVRLRLSCHDDVHQHLQEGRALPPFHPLSRVPVTRSSASAKVRALSRVWLRR